MSQTEPSPGPSVRVPANLRPKPPQVEGKRWGDGLPETEVSDALVPHGASSRLSVLLWRELIGARRLPVASTPCVTQIWGRSPHPAPILTGDLDAASVRVRGREQQKPAPAEEGSTASMAGHGQCPGVKRRPGAGSRAKSPQWAGPVDQHPSSGAARGTRPFSTFSRLHWAFKSQGFGLSLGTGQPLVPGPRASGTPTCPAGTGRPPRESRCCYHRKAGPRGARSSTTLRGHEGRCPHTCPAVGVGTQLSRSEEFL